MIKTLLGFGELIQYFERVNVKYNTLPRIFNITHVFQNYNNLSVVLLKRY